MTSPPKKFYGTLIYDEDMSSIERNQQNYVIYGILFNYIVHQNSLQWFCTKAFADHAAVLVDFLVGGREKAQGEETR